MTTPDYTQANLDVEDFWTVEVFSPEKGAVLDIFTMESVYDHVLAVAGEDGGIYTHR